MRCFAHFVLMAVEGVRLQWTSMRHSSTDCNLRLRFAISNALSDFGPPPRRCSHDVCGPGGDLVSFMPVHFITFPIFYLLSVASSCRAPQRIVFGSKESAMNSSILRKRLQVPITTSTVCVQSLLGRLMFTEPNSKQRGLR